MMSTIALLLLFLGGTAKPAPAPDAVVNEVYRHIVADHPIGIPEGETRQKLWPLLTPRLVRILETAEECEKDYYRQNTRDDIKPEFGWLEMGLFSGGSENAIPAEVVVIASERLRNKRHHVRVRFTYRDAQDSYHWQGLALVDCRSGRCLYDDFIAIDSETGKEYRRMSKDFIGCNGTRWIGYGRN